MKFLMIFFFLIFLLSNCASISAENDIKVNEYYNNSQYWVIGDDLYTNKLNELFFQTVKLVNGHLELIYLKRFLFDNGDSNLSPKLNDVIERKSWKKINDFLYRDNNNLYCFQTQTMGGFLVHLKKFDPDKLLYIYNDTWFAFKNLNKTVSNIDQLNSLYISDGSSIYYLCEKIKGVDYESFHLIEGYSSSAEDSNNRYFGSKKEKK